MPTSRSRNCVPVRRLVPLCVALMLCSGLAPTASSSELQKHDRERGRKMLEILREDIDKHHLDPTFGGKDVDGIFKAADAKIQAARSWDELFGAIGVAFVELDDSHTIFLPPSRSVRVDHGWDMQIVGVRCLVMGVKPGSDAERKGLRPGDIVLSIDGVVPRRKDLWKILYFAKAVNPRTGMRLAVKTGTAPPRVLDIEAKVERLPKEVVGANRFLFAREWRDAWNLVRKDRYYEIEQKALVWQMKNFYMDKAGLKTMNESARQHKALLLDLRRNGGGPVDVMLQMIGSVFDRDITVGQEKMRAKSVRLVAKSLGKKAFTGTLVVLVSSDSGSAAEVFARVVQLEKRGVVIGDRTAGFVMGSLEFEHRMGGDSVFEYGAGITVTDLIMTDGQSLEQDGVKPDETVLPTPEDLAAGRDPALARAMELAGVPISAEEAGTMFPLEWGP